MIDTDLDNWKRLTFKSKRGQADDDDDNEDKYSKSSSYIQRLFPKDWKRQ